MLVPVATAATSERQFGPNKANKEQSGEFKLTEAEDLFLEKIAKGGMADYGSTKAEENDPNRAENWGPERVIRGVVLNRLCMQSQRHRVVKERGIRLRGARIDGEVNLIFAEIPFPLYFENCDFNDVIELRHAKIRNLYLLGTHTRQIYGDGLMVEGDIHMKSGFKANGVVRLTAATIGGGFECSGGTFINKGGEALILDGARIHGGVLLDQDFQAHGEVCLGGAIIGMSLHCTGGQFINKGKKAISAHHLMVEGDVRMRDKFVAVGEVSLSNATIGGQLECRDCTFINKGGIAILAENLTVKRNVYFYRGFRADGKVSLAGATIDGFLCLLGFASPEQVTLDLRYAKIGILWDEQKSWPGKEKLLLQGLVYKDFADGAPIDPESRVEWLARQPSHKYWPQPYEQLAAVLRNTGYEDEAKRILIEKNKDRRRRTKLTWASFSSLEWTWYKVIGPLIGYGYRPGFAFWYGLGFVVLGCVIFQMCKRSFFRAKDGRYVSAGSFKGQRYTKEPPHFNSFMYSLDAFLPVINLHQVSYWLPGWGIRWYVWFHIASGWIITTLLVLGLTGLIRT